MTETAVLPAATCAPGTLDLDFVRAQFPALVDNDWALFDNAGGSVPPRTVIDRVTQYMSRYGVQLGASYALSAEASERVAAGRRAAAILVNASPDEVVLGASTTMNTFTLARALAPWFAAGDEVVVTNLDHESNIGAWRRLAEGGAVVREWRLRPESAALELEDLDALLNERTRLVCFTQCANVTGRLLDAAAVCRRVHQAGALALVDGVAYAPHRRVDVKEIDADFYLVSLYKVFGPHVGLLYGKSEHLLRARNINHFFFGEDEVPYKLQPGNVNHELTASLPGVLDYLDAVDRHHFAAEEPDTGRRLARTFDLLERHEEALVSPLMEFLSARRGVRVIGPRSADRALRVPTVAFAIPGRDAAEIPPRLDERRVAVRFGHFYAYRAMQALGLDGSHGVVRASLAHYNTHEEVARLIRALDEVL